MWRFLLIYGVTFLSMTVVVYGIFPFTRRRLVDRYVEKQALPPLEHAVPTKHAGRA